QHHTGALAREHQRRRHAVADALAARRRARHHRDLVLETSGHFSLPRSDAISSANLSREPRAMASKTEIHEGGCTCRHLRYRMMSRPLFVHCCHCRWCQRETGAAFALNAMIEADRVQLLTGDVVVIATPTHSGKGQRIARCPNCKVAVWSNYSGAGDAIRFVRVGTLDEPARFAPDIHIFTSSKQPWV